jgi:hypothetical protein
MKLLHFSASICAALALVSVACSSTTDDIMMGSDQGGSSAGDKPYAGSSNNSAGDRPIGGSGSTGGGNESNGGEPNGGANQAGNPATGGRSSGGASVGGGAAGGRGGSTSGGGSTSTGNGGASSSGACQVDTDCVSCAYTKAPADTKACYCVGCDDMPMTKTQCDANQEAWLNVCANVALPCPAIKCIAPPDVACVNHQCAVAK